CVASPGIAAPPWTTQWTHWPPGQALASAQADAALAPPIQTPVPVHWLSAVQCVPALVPPRQVPPTSQSSVPFLVPSPHVPPPPPHGALPRLMFTAPMMRATVTWDGIVISAGMPLGHVLRSVLVPRLKLTRVMSSLMATAPLPLQSPMQLKTAYAR